jgi:formate hydrogenlyase transcriptional activator
MMQEFLTGPAAPSRHTSNPSLQELLGFERLLSDVSARFANVFGDRVVEELEGALKRLLEFLGFDRCAFWEFGGEEQYFLCSVAVEGVEPPARGPVPAQLSWFARELRAGRTIVVRSGQDAPPEAAAAVEYNRRAGIRSVLVIPLIVGGRVAAAIGFGAFRSTREWPAVRHAGNGHWRSNGSGACTRPLGSGASSQRAALAVDI